MGFLGISAHKYTYHQGQDASAVNDNWLPDPVLTSAMSAVVQGANPAEAVKDYLSSGNGYNFKKAYQYQKLRWKKRICNYYVSHFNTSYSGSTIITGSYDKTLTEENIKELLPQLENKFWKVDEYFHNLSYSGSKFFYDMDNLYGLNDFTEPDTEGNYVLINGLNNIRGITVKNGENLSTSYMIGYEIRQNIPAIILDPRVNEENLEGEYYLVAKDRYTPKQSKGAVVWLSNQDLTVEREEIIDEYLYSADAFALLGMENNFEKQEFNRIYLDSSSSGSDFSGIIIDDLNAPDDPTIEDLDISNTDRIIIYSRRIKEIKSDGSVLVEFIETEGSIEYDEIIYLWVDEENNESHNGLKDYYGEVIETTKQDLFKPKLFKFYGSLPLKQDECWLLNFEDTKAQKYKSAVKTQNDLTDESDVEPDAPRVNRDGAKYKQKEKKQANKLKGSDRTVLAREKYYKKKIKLTNHFGITEKDDRHICSYADLLGIDYKDISTNLSNNENQGYIYYASIFPSIRSLGSNYDEENNYLWKFWDKIYRTYGQSSYDAFEQAVNTMPPNCFIHDAYNLPRVEIGIDIPDEKLGNSINFAYIKKFKMSGVRTRNTKGKRKTSLKEVRAGKLIQAYRLSGSALQDALLNPSLELVDIEYYETKAGKEYQVGYGAETIYLPPEVFEPRKTRGMEENCHAEWLPYPTICEMMFDKFGYTFFINPLDNEGNVEVIAVAGLVYRLKWTSFTDWHPDTVDLSGRHMLMRSHCDLRMFAERNRKKYLEHNEDTDVAYHIEAGSKKRKLSYKVRYACYTPIDYKILNRMSGVACARLTQRCMYIYMNTRQRQKSLRGWVKAVMQIVGLIVAIVGAIYGDGGTTGMSIMAMAKTVAIAIVANLVIKQVLKLLVKVFGLKGLIAILVAVVIMVIACYSGQLNNVSSLPLASETANQMATNAMAQAVNKSLTQSVLENLKTAIQESIQNTLKQIADTSIKGIINTSSKTLSLINDATQMYIQDEMKSLKTKYEEETKKYREHMKELEELAELDRERSAPYDIKVVMNALMNKVNLIDPTAFIEVSLMLGNEMAGLDYLSVFTENKLRVEPDNFDPILNADFSLKNSLI